MSLDAMGSRNASARYWTMRTPRGPSAAGLASLQIA